ncbi:MAG: DUF58 domain-containing protein [Planctomycetes bacterium]|nr:DUF58 domain-containing protein [Planctomycetota bacterium]
MFVTREGFKQAWRELTRPPDWARHRMLSLTSHMWRERFTRPGRYVLIGAVATGIAGSFPGKMVGAYAFSFFFSLLALSMILSMLTRVRMDCKRLMPERCVAGSSVTMTIRVTNPTRRPMFDVGAYEFRLPMRVEVEDDPQYVDRIEPGAGHDFQYAVRVDRRGSYLLNGPTGLAAFPFGLTQSKRFFAQPHRLIVYPSFTRLSQFSIPAGLRYQPGGLALASRVGESMEFVGTREYQTGDRIRDLHQRSWARVGMPVVKQFEQEFLTRMAMLVDTRPPRRWSTAALESNLSMAAAVADYLARQEYVIDLFAAGPQLFQFQAGRSLAYLDNILDILACIERCDEDPIEVIGPAFSEELRSTSTVILLLLSWDEKRAKFIEQIHDAGVQTRTILISDDKAQTKAATAAGCTCLSILDVQRGVEVL